MRTLWSALLALGVVCASSGVLVSACATKKEDRADRATKPSLDSSIDPLASAAVQRESVDAGLVDRAAAAPLPTGDAGVSACRVVHGPIELPVVGPVSLVAEGDEMLVVSNDFGQPSVFRFSAGALPPLTAKLPSAPKPPLHGAASWPPCAVTPHYYFCPGRQGAVVMRKRTSGDSGKDVAHGKPGTRASAVEYGGHWAVATLVERVTSEGRVLVAQIVIDGHEPLMLSDDGAGATFVELTNHGSGALAFTLDARTAMVPIHVRTIGDLGLGKDFVVAVGGPPERGVAGALGTTSKQAFALVPMPEDSSQFGLAVVALRTPLAEDLPIVWSRYPNGLDPAPLAASHGADRVYVARVRPLTREKDARRGLELGVLADDGAFASLGFVHTGATYTDPTIEADGRGGVWVAYTVPGKNESLTYLERRACPR